jgi:uncharacterized protein involved in outer membrane biogenesis
VLRRLLIVTLAVVLVLAAAAYWFFSGDGVRSALEQQASAWLGQPVRIADASVSFLPRLGVRMEEVTVGDPPRVTFGRVDLSTGIRALFSRRIEDAEVTLSRSRVEMPLPFALPVSSAARGVADASAAAAEEPAVDVVSIRAITVRDVVVASRGREIALSADSTLNRNQLVISSFSARSGQTELSASADVELGERITARIKATANQLEFEDLLALAAAFTANSGTAPATGTPMEITASITAPRARLAGVDLARFEASLLTDGTEVRIEPLKFDIFGGRYDGWFDVAFGERLEVRAGAGVSNVDVAQLAAHGGIPDTITGRMFGSGRFAARGREMSDVLAALRGVGEVTLSEGTIRNLDVVRTVVLFFGRPASDRPPANGERYQSIGATFALADQSVRSDDLTLHTPDFDVFARGTLALSTKAIAARGELVLSEALSGQAGTDLYRFTASNRRIILPATITGTLSEPRVRIDAAAAARRGLQNEVERRLQDLFERVKPPFQ